MTDRAWFSHLPTAYFFIFYLFFTFYVFFHSYSFLLAVLWWPVQWAFVAFLVTWNEYDDDDMQPGTGKGLFVQPGARTVYLQQTVNTGRNRLQISISQTTRFAKTILHSARIVRGRRTCNKNVNITSLLSKVGWQNIALLKKLWFSSTNFKIFEPQKLPIEFHWELLIYSK